MSHLSEQPPTPTDGSSDWFRRAFDTLYPLIYQHRDDASAQREIQTLVATLGLRPSAKVLDIACGAGRHLSALRGAGFDAFGMDLSMALLGEAVGKRRLRGRVVRGDVRAIPFTGQFDYATNLFNSFGYFADDVQNFGALCSMAGVLKPGGKLIMDHMNHRKLRAELVAHDVKRIGDLSVESRRSIEGDHVCKRMLITKAGSEPEQIVERVRMFTAGELTEWFERAGLGVERVMGDFGGGMMGDDSPRMVMVGVKR